MGLYLAELLPTFMPAAYPCFMHDEAIKGEVGQFGPYFKAMYTFHGR